MLIGFLRPYYEADKGGGNGGAPGDPSPTPPAAPVPAPAPTPQPDVQASFDRLLASRGGDSGMVALMLFQENYREREQRRQLQEQLTQVQGRLPSEGSVVLNRAEAQRWQAYQALGAPDEVQTSLTELQTLRRNTELTQVADVARFKPTVLQQLDRVAGGLKYEVREVDENGKKERRPFVMVKDQAGVEQSIPLQQYAEQHWADFLPSLRTEQQAPPSGTGFVKQNTGGGAPVGNIADQFIRQQEEQRKTAPNPLMPRKG